MEIRRAEEKEEPRGSNASERERLLALFHECLMAARGEKPQPGFGAMLH